MSEYEEYEGTTGGRVASKEGQYLQQQVKQEAESVQQQAGNAGYLEEEITEEEKQEQKLEELHPGEAPKFEGPATPKGWEASQSLGYGEEAEMYNPEVESAKQNLQLVEQAKPKAPEIILVTDKDGKPVEDATGEQVQITLLTKQEPSTLSAQYEGVGASVMFSPEVERAEQNVENILSEKVDNEGNLIVNKFKNEKLSFDDLNKIEIDGKTFKINDPEQNDLEKKYDNLFASLEARFEQYNRDVEAFENEVAGRPTQKLEDGRIVAIPTPNLLAEQERLDKEFENLGVSQESLDKAWTLFDEKQKANKNILDNFSIAVGDWQSRLEGANDIFGNMKTSFDNVVENFIVDMKDWGNDWAKSFGAFRVKEIGATKNYNEWLVTLQSHQDEIVDWDKQRQVYNTEIARINELRKQGIDIGVPVVTETSREREESSIERLMKQPKKDFYQSGQIITPILDDEGQITAFDKEMPPMEQGLFKERVLPVAGPVSLDEILRQMKEEEKEQVFTRHGATIPRSRTGGWAGLPGLSGAMIEDVQRMKERGEFEGIGGWWKQAGMEFFAHSLTGIETMVPGRARIPDAFESSVAIASGQIHGLISLLPGGTKASAEAFAPRDVRFQRRYLGVDIPLVGGMRIGSAEEARYYMKAHPAALAGSLLSEVMVAGGIAAVGKFVPLGTWGGGIIKGIGTPIVRTSRHALITKTPRLARGLQKGINIPEQVGRQALGLGLIGAGKAIRRVQYRGHDIGKASSRHIHMGKGTKAKDYAGSPYVVTPPDVLGFPVYRSLGYRVEWFGPKLVKPHRLETIGIGQLKRGRKKYEWEPLIKTGGTPPIKYHSHTVPSTRAYGSKKAWKSPLLPREEIRKIARPEVVTKLGPIHDKSGELISSVIQSAPTGKLDTLIRGFREKASRIPGIKAPEVKKPPEVVIDTYTEKIPALSRWAEKPFGEAGAFGQGAWGWTFRRGKSIARKLPLDKLPLRKLGFKKKVSEDIPDLTPEMVQTIGKEMNLPPGFTAHDVVAKLIAEQKAPSDLVGKIVDDPIFAEILKKRRLKEIEEGRVLSHAESKLRRGEETQIGILKGLIKQNKNKINSLENPRGLKGDFEILEGGEKAIKELKAKNKINKEKIAEIKKSQEERAYAQEQLRRKKKRRPDVDDDAVVEEEVIKFNEDANKFNKATDTTDIPNTSRDFIHDGGKGEGVDASLGPAVSVSSRNAHIAALLDTVDPGKYGWMGDVAQKIHGFQEFRVGANPDAANKLLGTQLGNSLQDRLFLQTEIFERLSPSHQLKDRTLGMNPLNRVHSIKMGMDLWNETQRDTLVANASRFSVTTDAPQKQQGSIGTLMQIRPDLMFEQAQAQDTMAEEAIRERVERMRAPQEYIFRPRFGEEFMFRPKLDQELRVERKPRMDETVRIRPRPPQFPTPQELVELTELDELIGIDTAQVTDYRQRQEHAQDQQFMLRTDLYQKYDFDEYRDRFSRRTPRRLRKLPRTRPRWVFPQRKKKLKIATPTSTPKGYQKQILRPIGELKIVDKEQLTQMRSSPHALHSMVYGKDKKGGLSIL